MTLHWPDRAGDSAAPLETAAEARLPSAYQLDDAPGFERFFLITRRAPFPIAPSSQRPARWPPVPADARVAGAATSAVLRTDLVALEKPARPERNSDEALH